MDVGATVSDARSVRTSWRRAFIPFIGFELLWGTGFNGPILMGFVVAVGGSLTASGGVSAIAQVVGIVAPLLWGYLLDGGMGLSGQVVWAAAGGLGLLGLIYVRLLVPRG